MSSSRVIYLPEEADSEDIYSKLVEFIEESEREYHDTERELTSIDIGAALNAGLGGKRESYSEIIRSMGELEPSRRQKEERPREPKEHIIMSGIEQSRYSSAIPSAPSRMAKEEEAKNELSAIKERLGEIKPAIRELRLKRVNTKDLILPSLSLSDQIAELERIIEGVKENIFDEEHLAIVKQEVYGLDSIIERSERTRGRGQQPSAIEDSLLSVRRQRLQEAMNLLQNR